MIPRTLYLDMDGVLCDFDGHWEANYGSKKEWCDVRFKGAIMNDNLFYHLKPLEDAMGLVSMARTLQEKYDTEVFILTSVGTTDCEVGQQAANQKREWLLENKITFKPIFVSYLEQKGFYASPRSLLVDDNERAINAFRRNGGQAIWHTTPYMTTDRLHHMMCEKEQIPCPI